MFELFSLFFLRLQNPSPDFPPFFQAGCVFGPDETEWLANYLYVSSFFT